MSQLVATDNVVSSSRILSILLMQVIISSETSVLTIVTRRNIPEDGILPSEHCRVEEHCLLVCVHAVTMEDDFLQCRSS
jgi:hypothetical protein